MPENGQGNKRDHVLFQKLRFVVPACLAFSVIGSIGFVLTRHWALFTLCMLLFAVEIGLPIVMPAYFAFESTKKSKKKRVYEMWGPMTAMTLLLLLDFRRTWLDDRAFWISAVIGIAVAAAIFLMNPQLRSLKSAALCVIIFGALGGWYIIGTANEVYDHTEQESFILEVEGLDKEGGRTRSWYCFVTFPDGREERIEISGRLYNELEEGDLVRVQVGEGFFGIEYANVYPYEEGE